MMALPIPTASDVYIPLCGNAVCENRLQTIAQSLKKCTTKHEMFGSYAKWFKQHFEVNSFTIIHQCPSLWLKIQSFKEELNTQEKRVILLTLNFSDVKEQASKCSERDQKNVNDFFLEFGSEHITSNDDELHEFAEKVNDLVKRECEGWSQEDKYYSGAGSTENRQSCYNMPFYDTIVNADMTEEEDYDVNSRTQVFDKYPDIFGETDHQHVHVKSCHIVDSKTNLQIYPPEKSTSVGQLIIALNKNQNSDKVMSNSKFILVKTLPQIFSKKDLPALASVCLCRNTVIQKRALILLELAIWTGMRSTPEQELKYLTNAESQLFDVLNCLQNDYKNSKNVVHLALLERASNVYLMVLSAIIMNCKHNQDIFYKCSSILGTIRSRNPVSSSKSKDKLSECISNLSRFVKRTKDFLKVKDKTDSCFETFNEEDSKITNDLISAPLIEQVVVTFEALKKVFDPEADRLKSLIFLEKYLDVKKGLRGLPLIKTAKPESICIVMVFRALTVFLKYEINHIAHMDLQELCQHTLNVLQVASQREMPDEVARSLHSLLFHPHSIVRKGISRIFDERKKYSLTLSQYSRDEVVRILDPMLMVNELSKKDVIIFKEKCWKNFSCKFGSEKVVLCINVKDHHNEMKTALENHEDVNYNEMYNLIHLQDKNIIQLFAFQRIQVPVFYIMEDCSQNLQNVMKNYRESGKYFSHRELCHFLFEAFSALQYCHDNDYIHRNLTAQSLALIQNKSVKLCSLGLCARLQQSQKIIDPGIHKHIPFRWSAPESLFQNEYTKQSDIWMAGILIYEVMTHGILPFSGFKCTESELFERLKQKSVRLNSERCIDDVMSQLIADCSSYEAESRPYVENVKTRLEEIIKEANQCPRTTDQYPYPRLDSEGRLSSTIFNRGPRFNASVRPLEYEMGDYSTRPLDFVDVSEILKRFKKNGHYIFFEEVVHKMPPVMLSQLKTEELKMIMPHLQSIKICQGEESLQCLFTSIPASKSLLSLALDGEIESVPTLLDIIFQVADKLSKIASMDLILGDLYPSAVYVEESNPRKVHIVSLAFMKKPVNDSYQAYDEHQPNIPEFMIARAAPELIQEKNFCKESDVYCFGNFMWETLKAFDSGKSSVFGNVQPTSPFGNLPKSQLRDAVLKNEWEDNNPCPSCCPDKIYQLIKTCVNGLRRERPTMRHVVIKLKEYCKDLFDIDLKEAASNFAEDPRGISSLSSAHSLSECNPSSMCSDSDYVPDYQSIISQMSEKYLQEVNPSEYSGEETYSNIDLLVDYSINFNDLAFVDDKDEYEIPVHQFVDGNRNNVNDPPKADSSGDEEIYSELDQYEVPTFNLPQIPKSPCPTKPELLPKPFFPVPLPPPKGDKPPLPFLPKDDKPTPLPKGDKPPLPLLPKDDKPPLPLLPKDDKPPLPKDDKPTPLPKDDKPPLPLLPKDDKPPLPKDDKPTPLPKGDKPTPLPKGDKPPLPLLPKDDKRPLPPLPKDDKPTPLPKGDKPPLPLLPKDDKPPLPLLPKDDKPTPLPKGDKPPPHPKD